MKDKFRFSNYILFVQISSIPVIIFKVLHILLVLEINYRMQRNDLWFSYWIFNEPITSSFEYDYNVIVELIPIFKEDLLILIIVTHKNKFFLTYTVE